MELMANCRMRVGSFSAWGWLREKLLLSTWVKVLAAYPQ